MGLSGTNHLQEVLILNLENITHPAVRDLAWCLFSPSLIESVPQLPQTHMVQEVATTDIQVWLTSLDKTPDPLIDYLKQHPTNRLGIYFENLLAFYYQSASRQKLLARNLQVCAQGMTLGEFDFLLSDPACSENYIHHTELAVKFYLGNPALQTDTATSNTRTPNIKASGSNTEPPATGSPWHQWLGPNCKDRLDKKLNHLQQHQLRLSEQQPAADILLTLVNQEAVPNQSSFIHSLEIQTRLLVRGVFFYPFKGKMLPPRHAHPEHIRGIWFHLSDFINQAISPAGSQWIILSRLQWLAPPPVFVPEKTTRQNEAFLQHPSPLKNKAVLHYRGSDIELLKQNLQDYFQHNRTPLMLLHSLAQQHNGNQRMDSISQRIFVVPDQWPWTT